MTGLALGNPLPTLTRPWNFSMVPLILLRMDSKSKEPELLELKVWFCWAGSS